MDDSVDASPTEYDDIALAVHTVSRATVLKAAGA